MDSNLVDIEPMAAGWGRVYQGATVDAAVAQLPGPLLIVTMNAGEIDEPFVNHQSVLGILYIGIDDSPEACLPDAVLIAHVEACLAYLSRGISLLVHCGAGISRSSYLDAAIHMRQLGWTFDQAIAFIRKARPQASPNAGFEAQLRRLDHKL